MNQGLQPLPETTQEAICGGSSAHHGGAHVEVFAGSAGTLSDSLSVAQTSEPSLVRPIPTIARKTQLSA